MPRGKAAAADPTTKAPKKRRRRGRRAKRGPAAGFAPFLLFSAGPRKKPRVVATFGALKAKVAALVRRGIAPEAIGIYQRRKAKVEQVVKI